jgi:hypothetical protein
LRVGQWGVDRVGRRGGVKRGLVIRGVCDDRVNAESRAEARGVFLEDDMDGSGDAASLGVVDAVRMGVSRIADHNATKRAFRRVFRRNLSGTLAKTAHPKTRNFDASGADDVRTVRGIPPVRLNERL